MSWHYLQVLVGSLRPGCAALLPSLLRQVTQPPYFPPDPRVTTSPGVSLLLGAARCHTATSWQHGLIS
jgi:hypothetical protein